MNPCSSQQPELKVIGGLVREVYPGSGVHGGDCSCFGNRTWYTGVSLGQIAVVPVSFGGDLPKIQTFMDTNELRAATLEEVEGWFLMDEGANPLGIPDVRAIASVLPRVNTRVRTTV